MPLATGGAVIREARPRDRATTRAPSSRAWPSTTRGPAAKPRRALSPMVTVSRGPGIMAPESPTTKAVEKMATSSNAIPPGQNFSPAGGKSCPVEKLF